MFHVAKELKWSSVLHGLALLVPIGLTIPRCEEATCFMKLAFESVSRCLLFHPLVFSMKDLSRNLKLTVSNSSLWNCLGFVIDVTTMVMSSYISKSS
ncbi:hypothetical protein Tco_1125286 [Tanacetum coccineum]|uniref:Secreted protein n=1 Tax=Tanacetum coccineum TaxID=301880 RepID=A0ABQ5J9Q6_9ASTR